MTEEQVKEAAGMLKSIATVMVVGVQTLGETDAVRGSTRVTNMLRWLVELPQELFDAARDYLNEEAIYESNIMH